MSTIALSPTSLTIQPVSVATPSRAPELTRRQRPVEKTGLTVLVPAYNEAKSIADTIRSLQAQTLQADEIVVIDDCSSDETGEIARSLGVRVVRTPKNCGCKANALNYGLKLVDSEFTLAVDADTTFDPGAIEKLMSAFDDPEVAAACGFVLPRHVNTIWERGRYIEYLFAFGLYKPIQDYYEKPLLASGCFSAYRTEDLRAAGGWPTRTVAEDMDLTWMMYMRGKRVRFVPEAVCYPIEPHNLHYLSKQLRRWSCGFLQTVKIHWREVLHVPFLRTIVAIGVWDATIAALALVVLLPLLAIFVSPIFLLGYVMDIPAVLIPVLYRAHQRGEVRKALASIPGFFVLRFVNAWFVLVAIWREVITSNRLKTFEKGH
ncbi:MAG: glycosyltransferase family 2 protein [Planctomycetota bacterium]|nr:glycosyltransferase family 2 protein [Planctomycetota bacterium]